MTEPKLVYASLLFAVLLTLTIIPDSEAASISEKRIKKMKLLTPEKTPNDKAVQKDTAQKNISNYTGKLLIPDKTTNQPNWSNATDPMLKGSNPKWEMYTKIKVIGIVIDCKQCADYMSLAKYDTSPAIMGKITPDGRISSAQANNPEWLRFTNHTIIMLDPPYKIAQKSQMISIVSQLPAVNMTSDGFVREIQHSRLVDSQCLRAKTIPALLDDTINFLKSNCTSTNIVTKSYISNPKTELKSLNESPSYVEVNKWESCKKNPKVCK